MGEAKGRETALRDSGAMSGALAFAGLSAAEALARVRGTAHRFVGIPSEDEEALVLAGGVSELLIEDRRARDY